MNRLDRLLLTANKDFETWMLICFNSLIHLNDKINIYRKKKKDAIFFYIGIQLFMYFLTFKKQTCRISLLTLGLNFRKITKQL